MQIHVNGTTYELGNERQNLLSYLRFELGLTGSKYGCGEGLCGACTVLVDGQVLRACMATTAAVAGGDLRTIEGLGTDAMLHPVQEAFVDCNAMQCGYCIPGFIMTSVALLEREPHPSRAQIREALSENMCRCGTYQRIEDAVALTVERNATS